MNKKETRNKVIKILIGLGLSVRSTANAVGVSETIVRNNLSDDDKNLLKLAKSKNVFQDVVDLFLYYFVSERIISKYRYVKENGIIELKKILANPVNARLYEILKDVVGYEKLRLQLCGSHLSLLSIYDEVNTNEYSKKLIQVILYRNVTESKLYDFRPISEFFDYPLDYDDSLYSIFIEKEFCNKLKLCTHWTKFHALVISQFVKKMSPKIIEYNSRGFSKEIPPLDCLSSREAEILKLAYGLNGERVHTFEEIGDKLRLSRDRVRQIREKGIRRLRNKFQEKKIEFPARC